MISVALTGSCGESQTLTAARHSAYNADKALVMREIVAYLDEHYARRPAIEEPEARPDVDAAAGTISTPWHLLGSNERRDLKQPPLQVVLADYIRFDIAVVDGPPWRVHVVSHAGQMMAGARVMAEIPGDQQEFVTETNRVTADIYRRLQQYAVPVE